MNEMEKGFDQVVNIINQAREVLRKKLQELANIPQIEDNE